MRRTITAVISLTLILSIANPCLAKKKTGEIKKNVYTDTKFDFQITALSNWKVKTQKEPSCVRILMTQKNYKVSKIPGASRYTTSAIPTVVVLADTTSLSLAQVESCLFQKCDNLKNKDDYMIKLDLIANSEYLGIGDVMIDSIPARMYTLQQKYKKTIEDLRQRESPMGSTVIIEDFLAGHVILFKKEDKIYMVQFSCEREFFGPTNEEFEKIVTSWKFIK